MSDEAGGKIKCGSSGPGIGSLWLIGWLFTIGFANLTFWQGVLAILIWPYYLGDFISILI